MKKSLLGVALLGAFAGVAHAQTAVQIYGTIDVGFVDRSGEPWSIGKRANNTLGFKGTEELGNGLKALFQFEARYEPDTGTNETGALRVQRPLFQGQSRVGLQGAFGMVRLGRGLTPFQETVGAFDPWHALPTPAGFYTDLSVAGYTSQPLDPVGASNNRFSNGFWYNSPAVFGGFQFNAAVASKESNGGGPVIGTGTLAAPQYPFNAEASALPYSLSATYNNGPFAVMLAYEENAVETKLWSIGGAFNVNPDIKLMATYTEQDQGNTRLFDDKTNAWVLGLNWRFGPGKLLAGYGEKDPDGLPKVKQFSIGYEYSLSKRTYVYVDASRKEGMVVGKENINHYDIGVNHSF